MKVPISWLREYVEFDATAEELAEKLTFSGIEVEGIARIGEGCEGVVAGEVLSIEKHPDADRLRLCRVTDGGEEVSVVCGADNFEVGDKVAFAAVGAKLPGGMKIKKVKIRGQISEGMMCAEDELGLSDEHTGIMILPRDTVTGTALNDVIGPPETVLEVEITWNRADCLSITGIAREVAALFGSELKMPGISFVETGIPVDELASVDVADPELCPRYTARVLSDIVLGPSPMWMQRRLLLCGVRPISNVVDITNYVLLECGHPLHAFDYDLLADHRIVVRRAETGEKITTLDGIERSITTEMLVIADGERPIALGGIMGGAGSEIRDNTVRVLLESACFHAPNIRHTSSQLELLTESSHRFERGVDIATVEWASRRAAALMAEYAAATVSPGVIDTCPQPGPGPRVECVFDHVRSVIGVDVEDDVIVAILESLAIPIVEKGADSCVVEAPTFRPDLEIEADLIEEVARIHGLDKVEAVEPVAMIVPGADDVPTRSVQSCRNNLIALGLSETMNYSFLSERLLDTFRTDDRDTRVVLPNPVSADYAVLRTSLVPQMVESLGRNLARQVATVAFFEIGRTFFKNADGVIGERENVCIGLLGKVGRGGLDFRRPVEPEEMFLWLKGIIENLCTAMRVTDLRFSRSDHPCLEEGWSAEVSVGGDSGVFGLVTEGIRHGWRMTEPVGVAEIPVAALIGDVFATPELKPVPQYPAVVRDMALIVDENIRHEDVLEIVRKAAQNELTEVDLFDIFRGRSVGQGKKSLAYSLVYRSSERTLTDEDANAYHVVIKDALKNALNVEIREG